MGRARRAELGLGWVREMRTRHGEADGGGVEDAHTPRADALELDAPHLPRAAHAALASVDLLGHVRQIATRAGAAPVGTPAAPTMARSMLGLWL